MAFIRYFIFFNLFFTGVLFSIGTPKSPASLKFITVLNLLKSKDAAQKLEQLPKDIQDYGKQLFALNDELTKRNLILKDVILKDPQYILGLVIEKNLTLLVDDLISIGADLNKPITSSIYNPLGGADLTGLSPLGHAVLSGNLNMINLLITKDAKAQYDMVDNDQHLPVHLVAMLTASGGEIKPVLTTLLEQGFSLDAKTNIRGRTPLHLVVIYGNEPDIKVLLDLGAN